MARRNVIQICQRNRASIPILYDLEVGEMQSLCQMADDGFAWDAFKIAFTLGFVEGHRATKKGKFRERKT